MAICNPKKGGAADSRQRNSLGRMVQKAKWTGTDLLRNVLLKWLPMIKQTDPARALHTCVVGILWSLR